MPKKKKGAQIFFLGEKKTLLARQGKRKGITRLKEGNVSKLVRWKNFDHPICNTSRHNSFSHPPKFYE